jgi:hypothetical protein
LNVLTDELVAQSLQVAAGHDSSSPFDRDGLPAIGGTQASSSWVIYRTDVFFGQHTTPIPDDDLEQAANILDQFAVHRKLDDPEAKRESSACIPTARMSSL